MSFWSSIFNALTDDGIFVAQLGMSSSYHDVSDQFDRYKRRAKNIEILEQVGFVTTHSYEEGHCKFEYPWTFLIVCKSQQCDKNWYKSSAQVEIAIHERILPSKSGAPLLKYFDGATMAQYRFPHKGTSTVYCRRHPTPVECQLFDGLMKEWKKGDVQNPGTLISAPLDEVFFNTCADEDDCKVCKYPLYHMFSDSTLH